ncbi:MAG TPA: alpha-amylase family glycosyl hydrolase, partial [Candidatus Wallbacteria bacterium]|nr:alpha-amylase family glycosyl hydrolase [Candidatus Wallbacteria bacterium]
MSENFEKLRIYNLFPKLAGNMTEWTQHIPRIAEMGFNAIYVNPFHYCGFSGSLYSPSDYYRFNDQFIDNNSHIPPADQLKNFISKLHQHGMKFIMDLVINHTAIDSPLVKEHPEWYLRDDTGKVLNPFAVEHDGNKVVWGDLAEIDNEGSKDIDNLYKYWLDMIMHYMAMGVDGFRCDAAYKVPVKLWKYLNRNIRAKYPGALFLAETLGCEIHQVIALAEAGFDYTFN